MTVRLSWIVKITTPDPCPEFKPDPYTGEYPMHQCSVNHASEKRFERSMLFDSEDEARAFAALAPKNCSEFEMDFPGGKRIKL